MILRRKTPPRRSQLIVSVLALCACRVLLTAAGAFSCRRDAAAGLPDPRSRRGRSRSDERQRGHETEVRLLSFDCADERRRRRQRGEDGSSYSTDAGSQLSMVDRGSQLPTSTYGRLGEKLKALLPVRRHPSSPAVREEGDEDALGGAIVSKRGSVFEESKAMLTLSDMMYVFSALRAHAIRAGDEDLQRSLRVPQISTKLVPPILENLHLLKKGGDFEAGFVERALSTVNEAEFRANSRESSEVIEFGDSSDDDVNSCVYGIGVNRSARRMTVWFRGTVAGPNGLNHWSKNFDTTLRLEENPIDDMLESTPTLCLHRGFVRAILGRRRQIMLKILQYRREHPETEDFPLFVSGHSLGGALATLFGFYACQEPAFTKNGPVRVYTFAAPPVGNGAFSKVFRRLEDDGRIRLARIHNALDPVPSAFALTRYTHVGLGIELNFPDYEIIQEDRSSVKKIATIFKGRGEHKLSRSYEYLNRHAVGFNSTLDEMYRDERGI